MEFVFEDPGVFYARKCRWILGPKIQVGFEPKIQVDFLPEIPGGF